MSFYRSFAQSAGRWPQGIAVEMQRAEGSLESHTYLELQRMAESVGRWLAESGQPAGTHCALLAGNSPRWVAAYLGTLAAGMVAVPFDTALHTDQVAKLLRDSGARILFTDSRHLSVARRAAEGLSVQLVLLEGPRESGLPHLDHILAAGPEAFVPAEVPPDETAVILYTSGTTRDPAGVVLSHANLAAESDSVFRFLPDIGPSDSLLGILPLFHALAQMANLLLPFVVGARVVYLETLNTTELLRALRERRITIFVCVPQFFYLIHERVMKEVAKRGALARLAFRLMLRLSRAGRAVGLNLGKVFFAKAHATLGKDIRYLITGGSRFDAHIGHDLYDLGFDILQAYGLTETSGGAVVTPPDRNIIGSVGRPLPGVEVKIVDPHPADDGGPAAGEIAIRGGLVMKGYYNRPDVTAAVIRDGWLHTGDLGYFDADGNLFITGRRKEMIVLSTGKNLYPEEIEAHYLRSPWIKEICVLGLEARPGDPFSERLHAVVVPNFDELREKKVVNMREVIRFDLETLSAQLPAVKRVRSYDIWREDLPRTTTRKLKRMEVERRVLQQGPAAAEAEAAPERPWSEEDIRWRENADVARSLELVRRNARSRRESLHPADNLELDLGLDSMARVELLVELERELGAQVDDSVASEVYTVREMVDAVLARRGGAPAQPPARTAWEAVFEQESTDPDVLAVARRRPFAEAVWFLFAKLIYLVVHDLFHLKVSGLEKLPRSGPCMISSNHQSLIDAPILATVLPFSLFRDSFYVGTSEIFGQGFWRRFARWVRLVPIDPDANLVQGMQAGAFGLRRGKVLIIYPEGERSIDGAPQRFRKGAAILSVHLNVPIYPVAIEGFWHTWPRGKSFQGFHPLQVKFGDPVYPPPDMPPSEAAYDAVNAELKARVVAMWEELRGEPRAHDRGHAAAAD